ncbi:hypothetical protein [Providencia rettgeri]|uniref:phage tail fiber protein n=1 Tax=Providencia rettgeri TaxID=587 RepID=UPI0015EBBE94|nr:hypothetical protein H0913_06610 [Providencia rettgeri]
MIYQTGTITTTAGQTKIKGTGTRWKDNLAGISEGCPISYLINNTVFMNTVLSVNSDTEINLTYPVPVAASAAKYQIATFVLDSMSDGVRKIAANQLYIEYFLRNMDTWLTQDGIVEVKTPTGETVKLESIIALKKMIDGKFDKTGGAVKGRIDADSVITASQLTAKTPQDSALQLNPINSGPRIEHRINGGTWYIHTLPNATGTVLQSNDLDASVSKYAFFAGNGGIPVYGNYEARKDKMSAGGLDLDYADQFPIGVTASITTSADANLPNGNNWRFASVLTVNGWFDASGSDARTQLIIHDTGVKGRAGVDLGPSSPTNKRIKYTKEWNALTDKNTTKDSNGNIKSASPIIKVFADHIELNDESEGVELEKIGTGRYKLKGTLGMNSDASWGGIHGGLVVPNGINNLPLVWADFDVLSDGDIIIETRYRKHTLHPRLEAQRLMTYPEFLDENNVEREDYDYCDIPNGHWIDVRVNMPSDSIYNQKLAEAEQLAKIEAERVVKEEAEKAARDEAERLEEESKQEQASKLEE